MNELEKLLREVKQGGRSVSEAASQIEKLFFTDLGHSMLDTDRKRRTGQGEVIYCAGKTVQQIRDIVITLKKSESNILGTRMDRDIFEQLRPDFPDAVYKKDSKLFMIVQEKPAAAGKGHIAVV
jgi:NCAIR mutase (PurE)-related protein